MASKAPGIQLDVAEELRAMRLQGLKDVAAVAELRGRVAALEAWRRAAESQRTAALVAAVTAVVTAFGAIVVLLFNHHG